MLHIGGLQKTSLIDFPGKVGCVLFLSGCNYRCPYCHNPKLVNMPDGDPSDESLSEFYGFLEQRRGLLEGVVISGGEPTLQPALVECCKTIKHMGYAVKLDTNGSRPEVLQRLLYEGLVDYVAMDIKTVPHHYTPVFSPTRDWGAVLDSIVVLRDWNGTYEYRTTCIKPVISPSTINAIGRLIEGAPLYALQTCRTETVLKPSYFNKKQAHPFTADEMQELKAAAQKWVGSVVLR